MKLYLLRHGNTFVTGQTPVMIGAHEDLPLVERGVQQAEIMRDVLPSFEAVYVASLRRTREYARIIARTAPITIDDRLRELDYGVWSGLSDEQIRLRGDGDLLDAWRTRNVWPPVIAESFASVSLRLRALLGELAGHRGPIALVTSQGILKTFGILAADHPADLKVATGHACLLTVSDDGTARVEGWNMSPAALAHAP